MAYYIKVDVRKVAEAISKDAKFQRELIGEGQRLTHSEIIEALLVILRAQRLALTDSQFRFRYVNYIKK